MIIGFTGTRAGMTDAQKQTLARLLDELHVTVFRHGDCIGADAEAAAIADDLQAWIVCHPPTDTSRRAYARADETRFPLPYLARNRAIVLFSELIIGASLGAAPYPAGGTWYTIRYARKSDKPVIVIWPDGTFDTYGVQE